MADAGQRASGKRTVSVIGIAAAGSYGAAQLTDSVVVNRADYRAGENVTTLNGVTLAIPQLPADGLRMGHALVLEDGRHVEVVLASEPLLEVREPDLGRLARLAWKLGDRHMPMQILPKRLRVSHTDITAALLRRLGATFRAIEGPFEPEGGAYRAHGPHQHGAHQHSHSLARGRSPG